MNSPISRTLVFFLFTSLAVLGNRPAEAGLVAGDVAIIGINTRDPNGFAWLPLVDLAEGTTITFTDAGYKSGGGFGTGEGFLTYTAPSGGIAAGTVLNYAANVQLPEYVMMGTFSLHEGGDQVIAFSDTTSPPTFLFAAQTNSSEFQATQTQSNDSGLPPGLNVGLTAVALGFGPGYGDEYDNARYKGITAGTKEELLMAIAKASNWEKRNGAGYDDLTNGVAQFNVQGVSAVPESNGLFVGAVVSLVALAWGCIVARRHRQPA